MKKFKVIVLTQTELGFVDKDGNAFTEVDGLFVPKKVLEKLEQLELDCIASESELMDVKRKRWLFENNDFTNVVRAIDFDSLGSKSNEKKNEVIAKLTETIRGLRLEIQSLESDADPYEQKEEATRRDL